MEPFSFAFLTDPQIGMDSPSGLDAPDSDRARLEACIEFINEWEAEFVVLGGDLIHSASGPKAEAEAHHVVQALAKLTVPYYGVAGNHDQGPKGEPWPYVEGGLPLHFSMQHKEVAFIGPNACNLRGTYEEDCQAEEWNWMREAFAKIPDDCAQRWVAMHWPLLNSYPTEEETYWNMKNREELVDFFVEQKVSCVLSGHFHQDVEVSWKGIPLVNCMSANKPLQYAEQRAFKMIMIFDGGWSIRRVSVDDLLTGD
jgi:predicted phosphodiesterase